MTRQISLKNLLLAGHYANKHPDGRIATGLWDDPFWSVDRFKGWFRACLMDKINARDENFPSGRKAQPDYETELYRLRRYQGNRVIIDWLPKCLDERILAALSPRLRSCDDY